MGTVNRTTTTPRELESPLLSLKSNHICRQKTMPLNPVPSKAEFLLHSASYFGGLIYPFQMALSSGPDKGLLPWGEP